MKARSEDNIPAKAQVGLKDTLRKQGYFLACQCYPESTLVFSSTEEATFKAPATILELKLIGPDVMRVRFDRPNDLTFYAGQFLNFMRPDGLIRSYSIATLPSNSEYFEIHVRRIPGGNMSVWFHEQANVGESVLISGPQGECFYTLSEKSQQENPIILAGTGTGVAPLYAVALDAALQGHQGPIRIYQGATHPERLYLEDELITLASIYPNLTYHPCVLTQGETDTNSGHRSDLNIGNILDIVLKDAKELGDLKALQAYLCGDPGIVNNLRKRLFLSGASLHSIYADAFIGTDGSRQGASAKAV